jgi:hypothetical protein
MKVYVSKREAIIGLHERGFTEDFEMSGDNVWWIQQKTFLSSMNFELMESYFFPDEKGKETIILAVMVNGYCAKGILILHQKNNSNKTSPPPNNKFIKPVSLLQDNNYHYAFAR